MLIAECVNGSRQCAVVNAYELRNATLGSTRAARRAGR
jgi:hypothetical protein